MNKENKKLNSNEVGELKGNLYDLIEKMKNNKWIEALMIVKSLFN